MTRTSDSPQDGPARSERFIDMAREVEAEGSNEDFDRAFEKVANETPKNSKSAP